MRDDARNSGDGALLGRDAREVIRDDNGTMRAANGSQTYAEQFANHPERDARMRRGICYFLRSNT